MVTYVLVMGLGFFLDHCEPSWHGIVPAIHELGKRPVPLRDMGGKPRGAPSSVRAPSPLAVVGLAHLGRLQGGPPYKSMFKVLLETDANYFVRR